MYTLHNICYVLCSPVLLQRSIEPLPSSILCLRHEDVYIYAILGLSSHLNGL